MPFTPKTDWEELPSTATPVTADELTRVENGISDVTDLAEAAVPSARTVNGKALSANITLNGADIPATGYTIGTGVVAVTAADTLNAAIAKLEARLVILEGA